MKFMTGNELREAYLEFFAKKAGIIRDFKIHGMENQRKLENYTISIVIKWKNGVMMKIGSIWKNMSLTMT